MTRKEMNQIMGAINNIAAQVSELRSEVDALKGVSGKKSTTSSSKSTTTTSSKKKTANKTTTTKISDFEPKKDSDGNYNYKSWKTCRRNFVAKKAGKDLTKEWMDYAEFCELAKPFDKQFPYVKKSER